MKKSISKKMIWFIVIAVIVILAIVYYFGFYTNIVSATRSLKQDRADMEIMIDYENSKAQSLVKYKEFLADPENTKSRIESYDNLKAELQELNTLMNGTVSYDINFSQTPEMINGAIWRTIGISFTAPNYANVNSILTQIINSKLRNHITNIQVQGQKEGLNGIECEATAEITVAFIETDIDSEDMDDGIIVVEQTEPETEQTDSDLSKLYQ